jgi:hypothetical protein
MRVKHSSDDGISGEVWVDVPRSKGPYASKAIYTEYTTDELLKMCADNALSVRHTDDEHINRMYAIIALRSVGLLEAIK